MTDPSPRYVVREISGYDEPRWPRETTHITILDSWNAYHVVASYPPRRGLATATRRRRAVRLASEWNHEHDAWLSTGGDEAVGQP